MRIDWPRHVDSCRDVMAASWLVWLVWHLADTWPWRWYSWPIVVLNVAMCAVALFGPRAKGR